MPCFNHGEFIEEAIASVRAQTIQDFEIIVVDDGSTETASVEALRAVQAPDVVVHRTANRGLPAARNFAARHASGDVFCALDADDRLAPTWFAKGLAVLDAQPSTAFVSHWLETFGDEHWTWTPDRCDLPALLARNTVNGAALVRRAAFESVGGYDESMRDGCEDWDFWLRLVESGRQGAIVPEVLFYYRRRAGSMSRVMLHAAERRPLQTLIRKHRGSYGGHFLDVLVAKDAETRALAREVRDLERESLTVLAPALDRAREELSAASEKTARVGAARAKEETLERLTWKAAELEREVAALRGSWSWRLTAPLRKIYSILTARGSGR
jgi:glycosyltransferase involved in cell wall biosynthesis